MPARDAVRLTLPGLGDDSVLLGAAEMALEPVFVDPVASLAAGRDRRGLPASPADRQPRRSDSAQRDRTVQQVVERAFGGAEGRGPGAEQPEPETGPPSSTGSQRPPRSSSARGGGEDQVAERRRSSRRAR